MLRMICACAATAAACFGVSATTGFASHADTVKVIRVGGAAYFPIADVYCIPERPSGAPRFRETGVACSSARHEYQGLGVWFSPRRVVVTHPPNGKAIFTARR